MGEGGASHDRQRSRNSSIIATPGVDGVSLFNVAGDKVRAISPSGSVPMFAGLDVDHSGSDSLVMLDTIANGKISATDLKGTLLWSHPSPLYFAALHPAVQRGVDHGRQILAAADGGGTVVLMDVKGKVLVQWRNPEENALGFCMFSGGDGKLCLAILPNQGLTCYLVQNLP